MLHSSSTSCLALNCIQEAQLPQRNSASAAHMEGAINADITSGTYDNLWQRQNGKFVDFNDPTQV